MKRRRRTDLERIGREQGRLDDAGLSLGAALLGAEQEVGVPAEPSIAYYYRRFPTLGDAIRELLVEKPKEPIHEEIERLKRDRPPGWSALVGMRELSLATGKVRTQLLSKLGRPIRRDRDDVESVRKFLEGNATVVSELSESRVSWRDFIHRNWMLEELDPEKSEQFAEVFSRCRLGYLIGGLYVAFEEPLLFFEDYARQVDPHRFCRKRLQDPATRAMAVADVLLAWGPGAKLDPRVHKAWRKLAESDPSGFRRADYAMSLRRPYDDGRKPKRVGPALTHGRRGVHEERADLVRAVADWLDLPSGRGLKERSRLERVILNAGLWLLVGHRWNDMTFSSPQREAEKIVAWRSGVKRSTIKQSLYRTKDRK